MLTNKNIPACALQANSPFNRRLCSNCPLPCGAKGIVNVADIVLLVYKGIVNVADVVLLVYKSIINAADGVLLVYKVICNAADGVLLVYKVICNAADGVLLVYKHIVNVADVVLLAYKGIVYAIQHSLGFTAALLKCRSPPLFLTSHHTYSS